MPYSLVWLPEVLRAAGLKVAETNGWVNRGVSEMGRIRGVMCHHTGSPGSGNMPTLKTLIQGRGGAHPLPGPLAQLGLAVDGTWYVIAAGRANHAGAGEWNGVKTGNSSFIGVEAENAGTPQAHWPDWQIDAYRRGVAAILSHIGESSEMCCGHKEYALPKGRKIDPIFDMDLFRESVRQVMRGTAAIRSPVPARDPSSGRPTLERGAKGPEVILAQRAVHEEPDGRFGAATEAAVRRFQRDFDLRPDGIVGPLTWSKIDEALEGHVALAAIGNIEGEASAPGAGAQALLQLIGHAEAPAGYGTLYGNNQDNFARSLITMTLSEVINTGPLWRKLYRSPACGRYQFMTPTLLRLRDRLGLHGTELFDSSLQDRLGYELLRIRGYERYVAGELSKVEFGLALAKEWASLPVLQDCPGAHRVVRRGETYYAGDGLNRALVAPQSVEELLTTILHPAPAANAA